jgi:uncharacterized NAD(P)/FAD-binding protein YdhS
LLEGATEPLAIKIIETRADLGRGLAYSARDPAHVTNGPAKVFSLYTERPEHFARYLARYGRDWGWRDPQSPDHANAHTPRWVYGDYIRAELARAIAHAAPGVSFQHVVAEAHDIRQDGGGGVIVTVKDGSEIRADPGGPRAGDLPGQTGYRHRSGGAVLGPLSGKSLGRRTAGDAATERSGVADRQWPDHA